jgi:chromosome segregation ATPase
MDPEKDALRIQAAAVAAQQAALFEEEARLAQRRLTLDQQEAQLASHLEEKRRRLLEFRDQILETRNQMHNERAEYERRVATMTHQLETTQGEIAEGQQQVRIERRRLFKLRQRLKRRWHRYWAAERAAMDNREAALGAQWQQLDQEKEVFNQIRLRANGEMEVSRRRLQEQWRRFRQQWEQWQQQSLQVRQELEERAKTLGQSEAARLRLEQEAEGLVTRIHHLRCQLLDPDNNQESAKPLTSTTPIEESSKEKQLKLPVFQEMKFLPRLDTLAGELADQRLQLIEHWQRVVQIQAQWQQERLRVKSELGDILDQFQVRERSLEINRERCRQIQEETLKLRRQLDGRQALLVSQTAAWVNERDRQQAELELKNEQWDRQIASITHLRQVWRQRHGRAVAWLREIVEMEEKERVEFTLLRSQWLHRSATLEAEWQELAQRSLALEQYRQKYLAKTNDSAVAEKRLGQLQKRWDRHFHQAAAELSRHRQAMQNEALQLEERCQDLKQWRDALAHRESALADQEKALEIDRILAQSAVSQQEQKMQSLQTQCAFYEQQLSDLREEVERLANRMLEEAIPADQPFDQAA